MNRTDADPHLKSGEVGASLLVGYQLGEQLYVGPRATLSRGIRLRDNARVLIKTPYSPRPSARDVADFVHEHSVLLKLAGTPVLGALALEEIDARPWLVLEDSGGQPLDRVAYRYREPARAAALGAKIAAALADVHRRGVVHRDLKPQHILVLEDGTVRLTGFRMASLLRVDNSVAVIQGSLAYMAPEQTGRMNRPVDKRADLYALGVTLYGLLTGRLPFEATDPLELIHAHIARAPPAPESLDERVPPSVSALVLKLLSKHAEDRYHGAAAVERDLLRCVEALDRGDKGPFVLGTDDAPDEFRVSHRLYGREPEVAQLIDGFERARSGPSCVVSLVGGYSGIGKTSVVGALFQPVVRERGRFVSGKFDQYKRDIPYATLVQAFRDLMRDILVAGEASLEEWRALLRGALGANGAVIVDVIPEVEAVVGPQPEVPQLDPQEAQNRFEAVLLAVVRVFARRDHPLVIFLDDLQWADAATLGVLKLLARKAEVPGLQLVLAYRDNEVDAASPFQRCIDAMRASGCTVDSIPVRDLRTVDVTRLVADTVSRNADDPAVRRLAELIGTKAGGNPFFVNEVLQALDTRGLFTFDRELRGWNWDEAAIASIDVAHNVIDLLVERLRNLPGLTQTALKLASCIGNRFTLGTLAGVLDLPIDSVSSALFVALEQGLIVAVNDAIGEARAHRFHHDRIQQAAYSLLSEAERCETHLGIGRRLRDSPDRGGDDALFDVVKHLDNAAHLIVDPAERQQLIELNLSASRRAKTAIAWEPARLYLEAAVSLFAVDAWTTHYATTFQTVRELAQCEFLTGHFERAEKRFDGLRRRASTNSQRADVATLQVRLYVLTGRYDQALAVGLDELELLGESFPSDDASVGDALVEERRRLTTQLGGRDVRSILELPLISNEEKRAAIALLASLPPAVYSRRPAIFPILAMKSVNLSLQYGNCEASCFGYSMYAMLLSAAEGDPQRGFALSEASIALNARLRDRKLLGTVLHVHANHIVFWKRPYSEAIPLLERAYSANLDVGDLTIAAYTVLMGAWLALERGQSLTQVDQALAVFEGWIRGTRHETARDAVQLQRQFVRALAGKTLDPRSLSTAEFDADAARARIAAAGLDTALAMHDVLRVMLAWYHRDFSDADAWLTRAAVSLPSAFCLPLETTWTFFDALTAAALWDGASSTERPALQARVVRAELLLRGWASNCPENFDARHALVAAEASRLDGRLFEAQRGYERGAQEARQTGMLALEAVACMLAERAHRAVGLSKATEAWLREQHDVLEQWGAVCLTQALEAANPNVLRATVSSGLGEETLRVQPAQFDALAAVKASQALSREFAVESLTQTLLRIVLENAGAQRAVVLLSRDGKLEVAGASSVDGNMGKPSTGLPLSLVRYVERTRSTVVLADALGDATFGEDAHFVETRARSVLCMPIVVRGQLAGALYLENALASGAFSPERLSLLEVLSAQLAICLENASLYKEREERAAEAVRNETLAWSDRRYREALESMGDAFCALDHDWRFVAVNKNYERLARKSRDALLGQDHWAMFPEAAVPTSKYFVEFHRTMASRVASHFREYYAPLDVWTDTDVFPAEGGGIVAFVRDVSAVQRAEVQAAEAARQREALLERETAARALAEETVRHNEMFAGMLGHDLRNPLSAIMSNASYLARGKASPEKVAAAAKRIGSSGDRMARMIDQLLDFTRIRVGGGLTLSIEAVDLSSLCDRVCAELEASHPDNVIAVENVGSCSIRGDADKLLQVLSNIFGNAVHHGRVGEPVRVSLNGAVAGAVTMTCWNAGAIHEDVQKVMFEPFRRGNQGSKGLGLGLYISNQIVAAHGGEIAVKSNDEDGTTFQIRLRRSPGVTGHG